MKDPTGFDSHGVNNSSSPTLHMMNRLTRLAPVAAAIVLAGCAPKVAPVPPLSAVDARREALAAEANSRVTEPHRIIFSWSAQEPEFRGSGQGVARIEPPNRARLDLFLDNGEAVAVAAVVGDELRLPDGIAEALIPPPPLLWASLGVFRPGDRVSFGEGRGAGDRLEVSYSINDGESLWFQLENRRVREAEVRVGGETYQTLEVGDPAEDTWVPGSFTYRHLPDFRQLRVELESVEVVTGFAPDIWLDHLR